MARKHYNLESTAGEAGSNNENADYRRGLCQAMRPYVCGWAKMIAGRGGGGCRSAENRKIIDIRTVTLKWRLFSGDSISDDSALNGKSVTRLGDISVLRTLSCS